MSLNNISLSPYLISQLYTNSLVNNDTPSAEPPIQIKESTADTLQTVSKIPAVWKSLGFNKSNILIAVNYSGVAHLPDEQLAFLTQLLGACKLSMNDVAIINLYNFEDVDCNTILQYFESKIVLLFGITTDQFGFPFDIPEYQVQNFTNYTVMQSPALQMIQNDKLAKSKLWLSLKKIFNI